MGGTFLQFRVLGFKCSSLGIPAACARLLGQVDLPTPANSDPHGALGALFAEELGLLLEVAPDQEAGVRAVSEPGPGRGARWARRRRPGGVHRRRRAALHQRCAPRSFKLRAVTLCCRPCQTGAWCTACMPQPVQRGGARFYSGDLATP